MCETREVHQCVCIFLPLCGLFNESQNSWSSVLWVCIFPLETLRCGSQACVGRHYTAKKETIPDFRTRNPIKRPKQDSSWVE